MCVLNNLYIIILEQGKVEILLKKRRKRIEENLEEGGRLGSVNGRLDRWLGRFGSRRVSRRFGMEVGHGAARRHAAQFSCTPARSRLAPSDRYISPTSCFCDYATHLLGSCAFPPLTVVALILLFRFDRSGLATLFICTLSQIVSERARCVSRKDQTARYRLIDFINYKTGDKLAFNRERER